MCDNNDVIVDRSKMFTILQISSASVSMIASATLIIMILRSHKRLSTPLHRLLFGLSISDFISSLALSFGNTLSPPDHPIIWGASGNMTLCTMQGFIHFWSQNASPLYNCSLCLYYLIEIKYTNLQEYLGKIEVLLHVLPVFVPLIYSLIGLSLDAFGPSATKCSMLILSPFECQFDPEVPCEGGLYIDNKSASDFFLIHAMLIVPLTIFISMFVIYREVSAQEERTNQYRFCFSSRGSSLAYRNKITARNRAPAYSLAWLLSWMTIVFRTLLLMTSAYKE